MRPDLRFTVEPADWNVDRDALRHVRDRVFVQEQQVPVEEEWDDLDPQCRHVLARDMDGAAIGTGRLTPERKIGRMAVLADWRGQGVGAAMLLQLLDRARELGWRSVSLHAQISAIEFYSRHGFLAYGDEFVEAGIRHRVMQLQLTPRTAPPDARGTPPSRPEARVLHSTDLDSLVAANLAIIQGARQTVCLASPDLDPAVLDTDAVLEAMRAVASRGRGGEIRLLVHDAAQLLVTGHRLIELVQRLPSRCSVRVISDPHDRASDQALVLNDNGGYLVRPHADALVARGSTCDPLEHARLRPQFERMWQRARLAHELRALDI